MFSPSWYYVQIMWYPEADISLYFCVGYAWQHNIYHPVDKLYTMICFPSEEDQRSETVQPATWMDSSIVHRAPPLAPPPRRGSSAAAGRAAMNPLIKSANKHDSASRAARRSRIDIGNLLVRARPRFNWVCREADTLPNAIRAWHGCINQELHVREISSVCIYPAIGRWTNHI